MVSAFKPHCVVALYSLTCEVIQATRENELFLKVFLCSFFSFTGFEFHAYAPVLILTDSSVAVFQGDLLVFTVTLIEVVISVLSYC